MSQTIYLVVEYEDEDRDTRPQTIKAFTLQEKAIDFQEKLTKYTQIGFDLVDQVDRMLDEGKLSTEVLEDGFFNPAERARRKARDAKLVELTREHIPEEYVGYIGVHRGCVFDVEETDLD